MRQMPWRWMPVITRPQLFPHLILILSLFSHLILPSLLTFISPLSPLLWRHFFILVQLIKISKVINIPGPLQLAEILSPFEFLLTLLFNGHLLSGGSHIFSCHYSIFCVQLVISAAIIFSSCVRLTYGIQFCTFCGIAKRAEPGVRNSGLNTFWLCELYEQVILFFNIVVSVCKL